MLMLDNWSLCFLYCYIVILEFIQGDKIHTVYGLLFLIDQLNFCIFK